MACATQNKNGESDRMQMTEDGKPKGDGGTGRQDAEYPVPRRKRTHFETVVGGLLGREELWEQSLAQRTGPGGWRNPASGGKKAGGWGNGWLALPPSDPIEPALTHEVDGGGGVAKKAGGQPAAELASMNRGGCQP